MRPRIEEDRAILKGSLLALTSALFYGSSTVIAKKGMGDLGIDPLIFVALSMLFGSLMVFGLAIRDVRFNLHVPGRYIGFIILAGGFSGAAIILLLSAVSRAPVVVVVPLVSVNAIFTLILAHLFLKRLERVTIRAVMGTLFTIAGAILVIIGSGA